MAVLHDATGLGFLQSCTTDRAKTDLTVLQKGYAAHMSLCPALGPYQGCHPRQGPVVWQTHPKETGAVNCGTLGTFNLDCPQVPACRACVLDCLACLLWRPGDQGTWEPLAKQRLT